ncbi:MAG: molybdenum cofactor biosynthesis protein MoaE [Promethearchaeota archaeon]
MEDKEIKSGIYNKGEIKLEDIIKAVKNNPKIKESGAILTFTGIVRKTSEDGKSVKGLKIDAYNELANKTINKICKETKKNPGIIDVKIVHLKGKFDITDDLVYVVVASAHREEGFEFLRDAVERYKKEVSVWKREEFLDGTSEWVH